jgi:hypothetical protein
VGPRLVPLDGRLKIRGARALRGDLDEVRHPRATHVDPRLASAIGEPPMSIRGSRPPSASRPSSAAVRSPILDGRAGGASSRQIVEPAREHLSLLALRAERVRPEPFGAVEWLVGVLFGDDDIGPPAP